MQSPSRVNDPAPQYLLAVDFSSFSFCSESIATSRVVVVLIEVVIVAVVELVVVVVAPH